MPFNNLIDCSYLSLVRNSYQNNFSHLLAKTLKGFLHLEVEEEKDDQEPKKNKMPQKSSHWVIYSGDWRSRLAKLFHD
jgi:hypothetical protein